MLLCWWTALLILSGPRLFRAAASGQLRYTIESNASSFYRRSLSLETLRNNQPIKAASDPRSASVANQYIVYFLDDWIEQQATDATATSSRVKINSTAWQGRIFSTVEQTATKVALATGGSILWIYRHAFYGVALTNVTTTLVTTRRSGSHSSAASRTAPWQHEYIDRIHRVSGQSAMVTAYIVSRMIFSHRNLFLTLIESRIISFESWTISRLVKLTSLKSAQSVP
jgi:hypothetical protein